jgi:hypothetical protein
MSAGCSSLLAGFLINQLGPSVAQCTAIEAQLGLTLQLLYGVNNLSCRLLIRTADTKDKRDSPAKTNMGRIMH